jgi:hypothetical protein
MWSARERGHGCVSTYLLRVGVARSTGYRWDKELHWLVECGAGELRRLRAECARLKAEAASRDEERVGEAAGRRARLRALILEAAVLGTSDEEVARLVWTALGESVSYEKVRTVIAEACGRAREVFDRYFAGVGSVGAADEIFLGCKPLLLMVEPRSLLNTPSAAQAAFRAAVTAMESTPEGRALSSKLKPLREPRFYAHLGALGVRLSVLCLEQVGPERGAALGRIVGATVAWRRRDKDPVALLRTASTGSLADETELAVIEAVDSAVRSSSAVECVNSRIRLVQVARKRLGEDFLYLLAVYHNMHKFGRGSRREGKTPAELAGIKLPTNDWIELLDLSAQEEPAASGPAAAPTAPSPAAADAKTAA